MTAAIDVPERFNAATYFLDRHLAEGRGARTAFRFRGRGISHAEIALRANRLGNALLARDVQMEQRVLLALPDRPEFAEAFWGAMKIGAVPVPVSDALPADELAFVLQDSRARAVIASEAAAAEILKVRTRCPALQTVIVAGGRRRGALEYERLLERASPELAPAETSRDDVALWLYTSGSTGRPKAAVHLHHDLVYAAELVGRRTFGIGPDDVIFSASKLHFAFGLGNSLYFPALVGAASVLVPERFEAERVLELIQAERPTVLFAVATVYRRLLQVADAERRFDCSSLRLCVSSGEVLPAALFHAWQARFGLELLDVVGSTEALHDFIANRPGAARAGSSGQVIPGFEARLVDDQGRPVAPGMVGQLLIKGDSTSPGYWNRHERTRATMQGEWLRTGDMFYQDTDGYFFFCGRTDDMLKVGGMWVAPAEVEAALGEHPSIAEVAVVGRGDADGLTKPHAFCVLREGTTGSDALAAELREGVRKRLGGYKSPRWIDFVPELPKTATGKIQRFALRQR
ncbi:MAG TPA: benzoate-CoA ligase family protein [Methylomirabilota bacterium]|nr:benzoate-CoA ligase family protein [Methylomirabilota bacterium]